MKDLQTSAHAPSLTLEVLMDYLEGRLSEQEVARVDQILAEEPEWIDVLENLELGLEKDPDIRAKAKSFTQAASEAAFRASPEDETSTSAPEAKVVKLPFWRQPIWQMAAVILVLLLPAGWLLTQNNGPYIDQMSELYLQPFGVTDIRSVPSAAEILDQGLAAYQQGNYAQAAHDLAVITDSQELNKDERLTATMYLGLSYLFSDAYDSATSELEKVVQAGKTPYEMYAKWYLAWSYWKSGKTEKAKAGFEELASIPSDHQGKAQKILEAWE